MITELSAALGAFALGAGTAVVVMAWRARAIPGPAWVSPPPVAAPAGALEALAAVPELAVVVVDGRDRVVFANAHARAYFRFGVASLGEDAAVLIRSADLLETLRRVRAEGGGALPDAVEMVMRRGPREEESAFTLHLGALPESAGYGDGALALTFADATRLHRLESLRREFVANVSHDLRTPVTIIKGYARTLEEDYATMRDDDRRRFIGKIARNTDRLHALLESLLELSTAENRPEPVLVAGALNAAVGDAVEALRDRLESRGLALEWRAGGDDSRVAVEPPAVARILHNLLENAYRYAAGATRVRVGTAPGAPGFLDLRVEDDGPGVAPADYAAVFRRFYRAEKSRALGTGGAGLGLALVKNLVLAQGGVVRAEPVSPHGFAVVVSFPVLPAGTP